MPGAAALIDSDLMEDYSNGIVEYQYTEVYQVIATNSSEGPATILSAAGLPPALSSKSVPSTGAFVWCRSRHPRRQGVGADRLKWLVTCSYTNLTSRFERDENGNPVDDPVEIVPRVDFSFQETYVPVTSATFRDLQNRFGVSVTTKPPWLVTDSVASFVHNSAGDKIERERRSTHKIITVRKMFRDWNNDWDDALNTTNDANVTLTQRDADGIRLQQTFEPRELLLADVIKSDVWRQGKLYFDVGFVLYHKADTWRHKEPDAGTRRWVYSNQYKPDGTQYSASDFTDDFPDGSFQEIPTYAEGEIIGLIGEPIPFNGYGMEIPVRNADTTASTKGHSFTMHFDLYEESDFSALGIT